MEHHHYFHALVILVDDAGQLKVDALFWTFQLFNHPEHWPAADPKWLLVDLLIAVSWPEQIGKIDVQDDVRICRIGSQPSERLKRPDHLSAIRLLECTG